MAYTLQSSAVKAVLPFVQKYAAKSSLHPALILAMIEKESNFNPNVVSSAGATGLMQLMPQYATGNLYDPENNIRQGIAKIASYLKRFNNNLTLALAAYNWGIGNATKVFEGSKTIPSSVQTSYIDKITTRLPEWYAQFKTTVTSADVKAVAAVILIGAAYFLITRL